MPFGKETKDGIVKTHSTNFKMSLLKSAKNERRTVEADISAKIILLGNMGSGKSCLLHRYLNESFTATKQTTIGIAHGSKTEIVNDQKIKLFVWDTAGDERYRSLTRLYYRDAKAAIICYDVTDRDSFDSIGYWIDELVDKEECLIYLVGTKIDLTVSGIELLKNSVLMGEEQQPKPRVVLHDEVDHLIHSHSSAKVCQHYETSSRTGANVGKVFREIAEEFYNKHQESLSTEYLLTDHSINLNNPRKRRRKCCAR